MSTDKFESSTDKDISSSDLEPTTEIENLQKEVERVLQSNGFTYVEEFSDYIEGEFLVPLGSEYSSIADYIEDMENVGLLDAPKGKAYYVLEE